MVQSYSLPASGAATPSLPDSDADRAPQQFVPRHKPTPSYHQKTAVTSLSEKDRQAVGASSRVTDSLRQMHASLQAELERSEYAHQTMQESTAAFAQLSESYGSLETMLSRSRDLLGTLLRSQKSDTWYLSTSVYMLMVVGAWLVFRRLLYGPVWWLVWLPLRVLFGVGSRVGDAALRSRGPGESGRVDEAAGTTGGRVPVEGLPKEDLPTVKVGQEVPSPESGGGGGDADSMVDEIGKIVDEHGEAGSKEEVGQEDQAAEDARPRDEL